MKHTQEKWEVASCNMGYYYVKPIFNSKCKTSKANAKLIASAPDLLEACKDLLESLGFTRRKNKQELEEDYGTEGWRVYIKMKQAIAKAEEE